MKKRLTMMVAMAAVCAAVQLTAMPTKEEMKRAEPVVKKLLAQERAALESGKKTRSEVAAAAMKLAGEADTDAAKLLLMKGAFALYVKDGNLEKAVETMKALEAAIADMPPQSVTNMIEMALLGVSKKVDGARLYKLFDESKKNVDGNELPKAVTSIKESATETKRQIFSRMFPGWQTSVEPAIESSHRGQNNVAFVHPPSQQIPAVVSRTLTLSKGNPCLFLKMASFDKGSDFLLSVLVNGKEVLPKRLICTPDNAPWQDITIPLFAWRGSKVKIEIVLTANNWWCEHPFFKRLEVAEGTGQEKIDIDAIGSESGRQTFARLFPGWQASVEPAAESSHRGQDNVAWVHPLSQQTPAVVSRTLTLSNGNPCLFLKMASFDEGSDFLLSVLVDGKEVMPKRLICTPDYAPWQDITIPLFAWRGSTVRIEIVLTANNWWREHPFFKRLEVAEGTGQEKFVPEAKKSYGGYTWSYRVDNGEAMLVSENGGKFACAVSPSPKGKVSIPETLNYVKVTHIGREAFMNCGGLTSVTIPKGVTHIGRAAFRNCGGLTSVTIPEGVTSIEGDAFHSCRELKSVTIPHSVRVIEGGTFWGCCRLKTVTIPEKVASIGDAVFSYCGDLRRIDVDAGNQTFTSIDGVLYTKDRSVLVACPNAITSVKIPKNVTAIRTWALEGCNRLTSVTIPEGVKSIGDGAFKNSSALISVTLLGERPDAPNNIFQNCGKLKAIHVPANAKSWAGMKEWQGIPLVFDAK